MLYDRYRLDTVINVGCVFRWSSSLYCFKRNSDDMTIGKTHPTLPYIYVTLKSDEVVKNVDEKNRVLTAKLKMLNFPVPEFLNFPKFCDQTTEIVIVEQTSNYIKIKTNTKAKGFPFTESFEINQV